MTYSRPGDHNVICDRTGYKVKRSECIREWNGLLVRRESWEPRHPQDFVRAFEDDQSVRDPRSEANDRFLEPGDVTADNLNAVHSGDADYTVWDGDGLGYPTEWDNGTTVWID